MVLTSDYINQQLENNPEFLVIIAKHLKMPPEEVKQKAAQGLVELPIFSEKDAFLPSPRFVWTPEEALKIINEDPT